MKKTDSKELLFDLNVFGRRRSSLPTIFEKWLNSPQALHVVYTPNPEQIVQSRGSEKFKQALMKADLLLPDGIGLVMASKTLAFFGQSKPIAERIAGVDVVSDLLKMAQQRELEVLVVGGRDYSPRDYFPYGGAKISWTAGFKKISQPTVVEKQQLEVLMGKIKPTMVFVAFGAPFQEMWIEQNRALLAKNKVVIAMAVGGSFDYLLDKTPRAPQLVRKIGLEWLFRLLNEPWRLGRQFRIVKFLGLVIREIFI